MSLFLNKVAGLHPKTFLKKGSYTRVFLSALPNILEYLSCKTRLSGSSAKYPLAFHVNLSYKMLPLTLFFIFLLLIFSELTLLFSEIPKLLAMAMEI